jgi:chromate transporter
VLPDLHDFVVTANGWLSDREFANCFAIVQAIPGPNMILMMSFIGWKIGGLPVAIASALVTFGPPCALAYTAFHFWDRFRETAWQQRIQRGAPVTIGLVILAVRWPAPPAPGRLQRRRQLRAVPASTDAPPT